MATPGSFTEFINTLASMPDWQEKARLIDEYLSRHQLPIVENDMVHFIYRGWANAVSVPAEFNEWNPSRSRMKQVEGTDFFYYSSRMPVDGRLEYKLWVDSRWILDPLNNRTAEGKAVINSEVRMPDFRDALNTPATTDVLRGTIDLHWIPSRHLKRTHPLFVYVPALQYRESKLPLVIVADGGEYLEYGRAHLLLDSLIAHRKVRPLIAAFIDPRTDLSYHESNKRMTDYACSESFLDFLEEELMPFLSEGYPVSPNVHDKLILGASMGGLIATYTVIQRPQLLRKCAVQSPAYLQANSAIMKALNEIPSMKGNIYIQTGTIHDTEAEARVVADILRQKGASVRLDEFPEGHNWTNWRTHLPLIFEHFLPC